MTPLSADDRSQVQQDATQQFWKHVRPVVQAAFALHILMLGLFAWLQIRPLLIGNLFSIAAYGICLWALRRGRFRLGGSLMCGEIILHATLATWVLGWDSNFYFYMFCIVPILSFTFQAAPVRRLSLSLAILAVAMGGYAGRRQLGLDYPLAPALLDALGIGNVLLGTLLLLQTTKLSVRYTRSMHYYLFQRANRDSLTNLYTRRRIMQRVPQLSPSRPVAVVLLDIDHFKVVNDTHGHDQGDLVLQRVARVIGDSVRVTDMAARWGGEEFLVLMPDTSLAEARPVAERIQVRLRETAGAGDLKVTATIAIAQMKLGEDFLEGLKRTDQALYLGKRQGRDRIMVAAQ